jgi:hypothetical protein
MAREALVGLVWPEGIGHALDAEFIDQKEAERRIDQAVGRNEKFPVPVTVAKPKETIEKSKEQVSILTIDLDDIFMKTKFEPSLYYKMNES